MIDKDALRKAMATFRKYKEVSAMADEFVKVVEYDKKGQERVDVYKLPTGAEQVEQLWEANKDLDDLYYALAEKIHDFPHFLKSVISQQKLFKFPMPEQDPKVRATNFEEVAKGYTPEMAIRGPPLPGLQEPQVPHRLPRFRAHPRVYSQGSRRRL